MASSSHTSFSPGPTHALLTPSSSLELGDERTPDVSPFSNDDESRLSRRKSTIVQEELEELLQRREDLLLATPDIEVRSPLLALIGAGTSHLSRAEEYLQSQLSEDQNLALVEYMKASSIIFDIVPRHVEYSSLVLDKHLNARYEDLFWEVRKLHEAFRAVKSNLAGGKEPTRSTSESLPLLSKSKRYQTYLLSKFKHSEGGDTQQSHEVIVPILSPIPIEQVLENDYDFPEQPGRLSKEEKEILDLGSAEGSWGVFRCEHPSCWDQKDKFRFTLFAELAHHYKSSHPPVIKNESFPCSYDSCRRSEDPFTRKDAYRDHLREHHLEDMLKRHKKKNREQEWWASRIISPIWWRCVRCLGPSINIQRQGWTCMGCNRDCEPERIAVRKLAIGDEHSQQGSVSEFRTFSPEDNVPAPSITEPGVRMGDWDPDETLTSLATQNITATTTATTVQPLSSESQTIYEFSHLEYPSHRVVPFTTIRQLGHGSLGSVDAVQRNGDTKGIILARKVIRLPNMSRKRLLPLIQQEVAVLRELRHRHIVQVISTYETTSVPRQFGILLLPAGDGDLSHYLERVSEDDFPEDDIRCLKKWQYCLASAVAYIHGRNVRHKDIKPSNAICKGDEIFLTDFGSAHQFSAGLTSSTEGYAAGITKMYSAPEVMSEDRRGRPADIYSLGCVFAEMATVAGGRRIEDFHDFRSEPIPDEPDRMTLCYYDTAHKLEAWFESDEDPWSYSLISKMLLEDQKLRPTAERVLSLLVEDSRFSDCSCRFVSADPKFVVRGTSTPKPE